MATLGGGGGRPTRGIEDHLHTQRSQLSTGTTICYALDSHYFRAKLAGKSISWCQLYQTSMQSASVERKGKGEPLYTGNKWRSNRSSHTKILSWISTSTRPTYCDLIHQLTITLSVTSFYWIYLTFIQMGRKSLRLKSIVQVLSKRGSSKFYDVSEHE